MTKTLLCILCPNGCEITAETEDRILTLCEGNRCPRGAEYALQELTCPMRNIATSVTVQSGTLPLCSVRLTAPIPKERIKAAVAAIHAVHLTAPIQCGDRILSNLLDLGVDVIATRTVPVHSDR